METSSRSLSLSLSIIVFVLCCIPSVCIAPRPLETQQYSRHTNTNTKTQTTAKPQPQPQLLFIYITTPSYPKSFTQHTPQKKKYISLSKTSDRENPQILKALVRKFQYFKEEEKKVALKNCMQEGVIPRIDKLQTSRLYTEFHGL